MPARRPLILILLAMCMASFGDAQMTIVKFRAREMAFNETTQRLYITCGADALGKYANSVVEINPASGEILRSAFIGSDPSHLVVSFNGKYVFVAFNDRKSLRQEEAAITTGSGSAPYWIPPTSPTTSTSKTTL